MKEAKDGMARPPEDVLTVEKEKNIGVVEIDCPEKERLCEGA